MRDIASDLEYRAYHEAGHAVAHVLFMAPFRYVTIKLGKWEPDKPVSLGHLAPYEYGRQFRREIESGLISAKTFKRAVDEVVCDMAGMGAIAAVYPNEEGQGGETDLEQAHTLVIRLTGNEEEAQAFLNWAKIRAKTIFLPPFRRRLLESVKEGLLTLGTLSYKEARAITRAVVDEYNRQQREGTKVTV